MEFEWLIKVKVKSMKCIWHNNDKFPLYIFPWALLQRNWTALSISIALICIDRLLATLNAVALNDLSLNNVWAMLMFKLTPLNSHTTRVLEKIKRSIKLVIVRILWGSCYLFSTYHNVVNANTSIFLRQIVYLENNGGIISYRYNDWLY